MPRSEISAWAEYLAQELAGARLTLAGVGPLLAVASADEQIAFEVLVTLSRTVALVLRPDSHPGGPIGLPDAPIDVSHPEADPAYQRGAQLIGFAAQGDVDMVEALARAALAGPHPLDEARGTLWAILEVLASEPVQRHDPQEGPTP